MERGVAASGEGFAWADRPTGCARRSTAPFVPGTVTEIHPQAQAFVATLAERLNRGAAFFIDYGFPEAEYYHPQRHGGTLMCHRAHRADADPLADVGEKDITAHVDFSGIALAAQDAGLDVLGYTTQARFLMNCGLLEMLQGADLRSTANAQKLLTEHEMGELFKVIGLGARHHARPDRLRARRPHAHAVKDRMRWLIVFLLAFLVFRGWPAGCDASAWAGCRATSASAGAAASTTCRLPAACCSA